MSPEERLEVVRYRPAVRRRWRLLAALLLIGAFVAVFYIGQWLAVHNYAALVERENALRVTNAALQQRLDQLSQHVTNMERGAEVDRQVIEDVRNTLRGSRQRIANLEEEITFYKGLMDPGTETSGLEVYSFTVQVGAESNVYAFKLLLRQVATQHGVLSGHATVSLFGELDGVAQDFALFQLSADVPGEQIPLRFRYFQAVEGKLSLPGGFVPKQVRVAATTSGRKPQQVEKLLDWAPQQL